MDSNEGALSLATPKLPISFAIRLQETLAGCAPVNLVVVAGINDYNDWLERNFAFHKINQSQSTANN